MDAREAELACKVIERDKELEAARLRQIETLTKELRGAYATIARQAVEIEQARAWAKAWKRAARYWRHCWNRMIRMHSEEVVAVHAENMDLWQALEGIIQVYATVKDPSEAMNQMLHIAQHPMGDNDD